MLERFSAVTELLRHFYAILSRDGANAPVKGSEGAEKVGRILKKFDEHLEWLGDYRKNMQEKARAGELHVMIQLDIEPWKD